MNETGHCQIWILRRGPKLKKLRNWEKKRNKNVSFYLNISLPVRIFLVAVWFLDPSFNHPVKDLEILKYDLWLTDRI